MRATRVLSQFAERVGPTSDDYDIAAARPLVPNMVSEFLLIHWSDHLTSLPTSKVMGLGGRNRGVPRGVSRSYSSFPAELAIGQVKVSDCMGSGARRPATRGGATAKSSHSVVTHTERSAAAAV